jgi:hypothetical protein
MPDLPHIGMVLYCIGNSISQQQAGIFHCWEMLGKYTQAKLNPYYACMSLAKPKKISTHQKNSIHFLQIYVSVQKITSHDGKRQIENIVFLRLLSSGM